MELKKLQSIVNEGVKDKPMFSVLDTVMSGEDHDFIYNLAKFMKDMDYSTTQREDAYEIMKRKKMDTQQIGYRFDNLGEFLKICQKNLARIKKDSKDEIRNLIGN